MPELRFHRIIQSLTFRKRDIAHCIHEKLSFVGQYTLCQFFDCPDPNLELQFQGTTLSLPYSNDDLLALRIADHAFEHPDFKGFLSVPGSLFTITNEDFKDILFDVIFPRICRRLFPNVPVEELNMLFRNLTVERESE